MRRSVTLAALALLIATASGLYLVEHEVQELERRLSRLNADLLARQQAIQVLKAEWSYLNQPDRLQELATRYAERLRLAPLDPGQVAASFADLPPREEPAPAELGAPTAGAAPLPGFKPARPASPGLMLASGGRST